MAAAAEEAEKKLRAVRKKLAQIDKLKEKDPASLDENAKQKIATEDELKEEVRQLEEEIGGGAAPAPAKPAQKAEAYPAAEAKPKAKAKAEPAPAPAPTPTPASVAAGSDQDKRIKAIRKKLQQIDKLKEKGGALDVEAQGKVASEAELQKELACLESGQEYVPPVAVAPSTFPVPSSVAGAAVSAEALAAAEPTETGLVDLHSQARADALTMAPGDLGLLLGDDVEKRFKALQKKLRDIGKLWEMPKREKLQDQKLQGEPGVIEEICSIRLKAEEVIADRRAKFQAAQRAPPAAAAAPAAAKAPAANASQGSRSKPAPSKQGGPTWQCNECGVSGGMNDLIGGEGAMACYKCGCVSLTHRMQADAEEEEDDVEDGQDESAQYTRKSDLLKSVKAKKAVAPVKKADDSGPPKPESARWPELKDVLESGDRGVDKSRQRKAIEVNRGKDGAPYDSFDSVLLKCSFLTRVQLKLPPGVLSGEDFQLFFPGGLAEGLLELILKENQLAVVPPGIQQLQRIRSIDLSHNAIAALPSADCWETISTTLELLDLSFNKLESIAELSPLKKLSQIKLDANLLTSLEGISWSDLKQLSTFSAVGNQITAIPEGVGEHAVALEWMEVSENKLVTVPPNIAELKKLKSLNLAGNPIKDQKIVKAAEKGMKDLKAYLSKIGGGKKK